MSSSSSSSRHHHHYNNCNRQEYDEKESFSSDINGSNENQIHIKFLLLEQQQEVLLEKVEKE